MQLMFTPPKEGQDSWRMDSLFLAYISLHGIYVDKQDLHIEYNPVWKGYDVSIYKNVRRKAFVSSTAMDKAWLKLQEEIKDLLSPLGGRVTNTWKWAKHESQKYEGDYVEVCDSRYHNDTVPGIRIWIPAAVENK